MDRRLEIVASINASAPIGAVLSTERGYTSGLETLQHEALIAGRLAQPLAQNMGSGIWRNRPETLLLAKPQQLFSSAYARDRFARPASMHHPALNLITRGRPPSMSRTVLDLRWPMIANAVELLAKRARTQHHILPVSGENITPSQSDDQEPSQPSACTVGRGNSLSVHNFSLFVGSNRFR